MARRNLDFGISLTRAQWEQLCRSANLRPDYGVFRWAPAEFDVIRVAMTEDERADDWAGAVPPADAHASDREVARFRWNDGRPYAEVEAPDAPPPPVVSAAVHEATERQLERWLREQWHLLLRQAGLTDDRGAIPADEPQAGQPTQ